MPVKFSDEVTAELKQNRSTSKQVLGALQGKSLYGGTVPEATVAKRRAANKQARKSRAKNRH